MWRTVRNAALAGQVSLLACSLMPGVAQPAKGAMLLASFFCCGVVLGSTAYAKRHLPRVVSNQVTKEPDAVLRQLFRCIGDAARGGGSYVATIVLVSGSDEPMVAIRRASAEEAVAVFERECQACGVFEMTGGI